MLGIGTKIEKLLLFVIIGEIFLFGLRLYAQVALSISSALIVFQTILGFVMYCKSVTAVEASVYII